MKEWKSRKLVSKFHRLALAGELRHLLMSLPIIDLEESQVGNYIYSGNGRLVIGSSYAPAVVRVRMVDGIASLQLRAPAAGIDVACSLDVDEATKAIQKAVTRSLN